MNIFMNPAKDLLVQAMDAAVLRNQVLADNLANVETPNYKRKEVMFEELLSMRLEENDTSKTMALKTTHARHFDLGVSNFAPVVPELRTIHELSYRNDGNNVDVDIETAKLSQNKIAYDAYAQSASNETRLLRLAITGRSS